MSEREVVLDEPKVDQQSEALRNAVERAERAEAELAKLKSKANGGERQTQPNETVERAGVGTGHVAQTGSLNGGRGAAEKEPPTPAPGGHAAGEPQTTGIEALREDSMMAHLLDSLDAGKDIGHYGRLVFAMVARHFLSDDEVIAQLTKDQDFSTDQAVAMLRQVEGRDYNPPRRERILEWQAEQEFPILPNAADPDCGNVYNTLRFPTELYKHIEHYQEEKATS